MTPTRTSWTLLAAFLATIQTSSAGYIIVKQTPCGKPQPCIEPVKYPGDHSSELYQLMLDNTWPTAKVDQTRDLTKSEHENLHVALNRNEALRGHYKNDLGP